MIIFYDGAEFLEVETKKEVSPRAGDLFCLDISVKNITNNPVAILDKKGFWLEETVGKPIYEFAKLVPKHIIPKKEVLLPSKTKYWNDHHEHHKGRYNERPVIKSKGRSNSRKEE